MSIGAAALSSPVAWVDGWAEITQPALARIGNRQALSHRWAGGNSRHRDRYPRAHETACRRL